MSSSLKTLLGATVLLMALSCTRDLLTHDPIVSDPLDYTLSEVQRQYAKRGDGILLFQLNVVDAAGDVLALTLASASETLPSGTYSAASTATAVAGDLVADQSAFTFGGTRRIALASGSVDVSASGNQYGISGTVTLTNGLHLNVHFQGQVEFEVEPEKPKEPEYELLPNLVSAENGQEAAFASNSVTVRLGNGDAGYVYENWTATWSGNGNILALQLYSTDGKLHPGTYTPGSAGDSYGEGQYNIGFDLELAPGVVIPGQGSNWWTVTDGSAAASPVTEGTVTVTLENGIYTIILDQGSDGLQLKYEGAVDALLVEEEPDYSDYVVLPQILSTANNLEGAFGAVSSVTLMFGTQDVGYVYENWTATYSGTGNILTLELYSADGKLHAGKYTPAEGGTAGEGQFVLGNDLEIAPGLVIANQGSIWWSVTDGEATGEHLLDGEVKVRQTEEGFDVSYVGHDGLKLVYSGPVTIE